MPLPLRPGTSASGDASSSPFEESLDSFAAEQRLVTAASDDNEFSNALDSFDAEFPDTDDHLDEYNLEHLAAASRPSAEWLTPIAAPTAPATGPSTAPTTALDDCAGDGSANRCGDRFAAGRRR